MYNVTIVSVNHLNIGRLGVHNSARPPSLSTLRGGCASHRLSPILSVFCVINTSDLYIRCFRSVLHWQVLANNANSDNKCFSNV